MQLDCRIMWCVVSVPFSRILWPNRSTRQSNEVEEAELKMVPDPDVQAEDHHLDHTSLTDDLMDELVQLTESRTSTAEAAEEAEKDEDDQSNEGHQTRLKAKKKKTR